MRAIISPSGSFNIARSSLPARLQKSGDHSLRSHVAQRDSAHPELPIIGLRTAGDHAAIVNPRRRRIARQLGKLQRRREALFHRLGLVVRDRLELGTPLQVLLGQLLSSPVLLDRTLLRHQSLLLSASEGLRPHCRNGKLNAVSNARASSSVFALVQTVMSMPQMSDALS